MHKTFYRLLAWPKSVWLRVRYFPNLYGQNCFHNAFITECIVSFCDSRYLLPFSLDSRTPKGWPSLFWSEESNDLFYWAKLAFTQSNRHRHCEVWIERVNTPPWVVTILIVTTVSLVQDIFGIAQTHYLSISLDLSPFWRGGWNPFDFCSRRAWCLPRPI